MKIDCVTTVCDFSILLSPAKDIKIFLGKSAEDITKHSKRVMTTMGEWELLDITYHKYNIELVDGHHIDELAFHVGGLQCLSIVVNGVNCFSGSDYKSVHLNCAATVKILYYTIV